MRHFQRRRNIILCIYNYVRFRKGKLWVGELGDKMLSWALSSEDAGAVEGDVIGVAFGQAELPNLSFFLNGELLEQGQINRIRGEVFPAISVAKGAKLRCVFDEVRRSVF